MHEIFLRHIGRAFSEEDHRQVFVYRDASTRARAEEVEHRGCYQRAAGPSHQSPFPTKMCRAAWALTSCFAGRLLDGERTLTNILSTCPPSTISSTVMLAPGTLPSASAYLRRLGSSAGTCLTVWASPGGSSLKATRFRTGRSPVEEGMGAPWGSNCG